MERFFATIEKRGEWLAGQLFGRRIARYILSGAVSFLIENLSFIILYYPLHLEVKRANIISISVALLANYFISKKFVFRDQKARRAAMHQFGLYLILVAINLVVSTISVAFLVHHLLPGIIAKPLVAVVIATWTYFVYRAVIFKTENA